MAGVELHTIRSRPGNGEPEAACAECAVRDASFCSAVPARDLGVLARARQLVRFDRRETIVREGDPAISFFNITSGVVKLYRSLSDGRTQIIGFRFPGQYFAVSETKMHTTTAEAVSCVEACKFSRSRLNRLTYLFPQLQARLLQMSHRQLAASEDQIFLLGRMTAREKIVSFLLKNSRDLDRNRVERCQRIELPMTRAEVADFLGLTTETVSRVLTKLAREKLITVGMSRSIRLIDIDSLRRISGY